MGEKIPEKKKKERLVELMRVVEDSAERQNAKLLGKTVEILVDGPNIGRTRMNKIVKFKGDESLIGKLIEVKIKKIKSWVLEGDR